jgi:hypothetical protein
MTSFSPTPKPEQAELPLAPVAEYPKLIEELKVFAEMLTFCRPAGSKTEKRFIAQFITPLGAVHDRIGNLWKVIPMPDGTPSRVMWSCHTDTVHVVPGFQELDIVDGMVALAKGSMSNCLGADCTTGVWIMRQMILANVPGTYIFHRQEECGGHGSDDVAKRCDSRLDNIEFAIAFDRKGTRSVITHQMMGNCASKEFVASIIPMLPGVYEADSGGTFTDTANYADMISECTNISVGYYGQHTRTEIQDVEFMYQLAKHMIVFDETQLVAARDPHLYEMLDSLPKSIMRAWEGGHPMNSNQEYIDVPYADATRRPDEYEDYGYGHMTQREVDDLALNRKREKMRRQVEAEYDASWEREVMPRSVADIVREYPEAVADLLEQNGYDVEGLLGDMGLWQRH